MADAIKILGNVYKGITHKKPEDSDMATIEQKVVSSNPRTTDDAISKLQGAVPTVDLSSPNFNPYSLTFEQREALRDVLVRTPLYKKIKETKSDITSKPVDFDLTEFNIVDPIMSKYFPGLQMHDWFFPGNDVFRFISPTLAYKHYTTGSELMNYGYDSTRFKNALVAGDEFNNLGFNLRPFGEWFNFVGVNYKNKQYYNTAEPYYTNSLVGKDEVSSLNYETTFPSLFDYARLGINKLMGKKDDISTVVNKYVIKGQIYKKDITRTIPTEKDPSIQATGSVIDAFSTFGGVIGAGMYWRNENGHYSPLIDSKFNYEMQTFGLRGRAKISGENHALDMTGYTDGGWYTMKNSISGDITGISEDPNTPSNPSQNVSGDATDGNITTRKTTSTGMTVAYSYLDGIEMFGKKTDPFVVSFGFDSKRERNLEDTRAVTYGLALKDFMGISYSRVTNAIPEIFSKATGDQISNKFDWYVDLNALNLLSRAVYGKDSPLEGTARIGGYWIKDDHGDTKPVSGVNLSLVLRFTQGATKKTEKLKNIYYPPTIVEESPNNLRHMEDYYDKDLQGKEGNDLLDDSKVRRDELTPPEADRKTGQ